MRNRAQFTRWDHLKASWAIWKKDPRAILWIVFSALFCGLLALFLVLKDPRPAGYETATITQINDVIDEAGLRRHIVVQTDSGNSRLLQNVLTGRNLHEGDRICVLHLHDRIWGYRFTQLALPGKCDPAKR